MKKVLVLDANQRSALAVIRSLGAIEEIEVYSADDTESSIGGSSYFCTKYFQHPSIKREPKAFLAWLNSLQQTEKFELCFPCTEISSQLMLMERESITSCTIPFAPYETVMQLANKGELVTLAKNIDVLVPESRIFGCAAEVDLDNISGYPVVVKPCLSQIWKNDSWTSSEVQIAKNKEQLESILVNSAWLQDDPFMLQTFIEGSGAGVFAIYDRGKAIAFFAHKRLREKPPQGGVSVLSQSATLEPALLKNSKKLLDEVNWHGVAMVEYRVQPDGTPFLMEVNTRFWGSLQLAIDAGVDFPKILLQTAIGETVEPVMDYNKNTKLRWLLGDIDSLYLMLRSSDFTTSEKLKRILSFLTPHPFTTRHQVGRLGDFKPAFTELKQYFRSLRR